MSRATGTPGPAPDLTIEEHDYITARMRITPVGEAIVWRLDPEAAATMDQFIRLGTALGIKVLATPHREGPEKGNRRWSTRRVTKDDVRHVITHNPGLSRKELRDFLFKEEPWTAAAQRSAGNKLNTHLFYLRDLCAYETHVTATDPNPRFYPVGWSKAPKTIGEALVAPPPAPPNLTPTHHQLEAGTAYMSHVFQTGAASLLSGAEARSYTEGVVRELFKRIMEVGHD